MPADNQTAQGGQAPFLKSLFSLVHDMSAVQRFSRVRMVHPENVLAHTGMVCVFAYAIARRLNENRTSVEYARLDMGEVMSRAVAHDMDETITGDIVRPTKYFSGALRAELDKLERKGVSNISHALNDFQILRDFFEAKQGREGYVVKLADLLAAICTVWIEVCICNNYAMRQPARNMLRVLANVRNAAGELFSARELEVIDAITTEAGTAIAEALSGHNIPLPALHGDV